jgi:hypothetical protein
MDESGRGLIQGKRRHQPAVTEENNEPQPG